MEPCESEGDLDGFDEKLVRFSRTYPTVSIWLSIKPQEDTEEQLAVRTDVVSPKIVIDSKKYFAVKEVEDDNHDHQVMNRETARIFCFVTWYNVNHAAGGHHESQRRVGCNVIHIRCHDQLSK